MNHWEVDYGTLRHIDYERIIRERSTTAREYNGRWGEITAEREVLRIATDPTAIHYYGSDSDRLMDESNADHIRDTFDAYGLALDLETWKHELVVSLYADDDWTRGLSPAAVVALEILDALDDYPLLDDTDYYVREWTALAETVDDAVSMTLGGLEEEDAKSVSDEFYGLIHRGEINPGEYGLDDAYWRAKKNLTEIAERMGLEV